MVIVDQPVVSQAEADALAAARVRSGDAAANADRDEVIARLALQAAQQMQRTKLVLRVAAEDQPLIDDAFLQRLNERVPEGAAFERGGPLDGADGGVLVETGDGRQFFDNTFGARLSRFRTELRSEIASALWDANELSEHARGSDDD